MAAVDEIRLLICCVLCGFFLLENVGAVSDPSCRIDLKISPDACPVNGKVMFSVIQQLNNENTAIKRENDELKSAVTADCNERVSFLVRRVRELESEIEVLEGRMKEKEKELTILNMKIVDGESSNHDAAVKTTDMSTTPSPENRCRRRCITDDGKLSCICPFGYVYDADRRICDDIDECLSKPCGAEEICFNKFGSYSCESATCDSGFVAQRMQSAALRCNDQFCNSRELDCINSYSVTYVAFFSSEPNLPRTFYTFGGSVTADQLSRPTDIEITDVFCEKCDVSTRPTAKDFSAKLVAPFAGNIDVLSPFNGSLSLHVHVKVSLHLKNTDYVHEHRIVIDVSECPF